MDHPRHLIHRFAATLALGLVVVCAPASAQNAYAVEVVIFRHWEAPGDDAEFWPDRPPPIVRLATQRLITLGPPTVDDRDTSAFSRLPDAKLHLAGIHERLTDSSDYEVLLHIGWRQPASQADRSAAILLPLNGFQPPSAAVETSASKTPSSQSPFDHLPQGTRLWGTLRLVQKRYLHFEADLRYRRDGIGGAAAEEAAQVYSMTQSRRMRPGEIHYIDHPVLGLMVQARKLNPERDLKHN